MAKLQSYNNKTIRYSAKGNFGEKAIVSLECGDVRERRGGAGADGQR